MLKSHRFTHACDVLELTPLLALIGSYTTSDLGRARIQALQPTVDPDWISARQQLLADVFRLREQGSPLLHPGFRDLTPLLFRAQPDGAILGGDELCLVRGFLDAVEALAEFADHAIPPQCALGRRLGRIDRQPALQRALQTALDEHGELRDQASPLLGQLRRQSRALEARIQRQLERLLGDLQATGAIQEEFVTSRNGRYVIPVKREGRGRVSGVVHDHSDSGRTLFLEPELTLASGNELADLRLQERDEGRRILAELTAEVRANATALADDQEALVEADLLAAIGAWAGDYDAVLPRFGQTLVLRSGRHPLLERQFRLAGRAAELVALDLVLPPEARVLLITGPNSGGKTAVLKAVGLLTLMAQAGLPVPIDPTSELVCFDQIFADIGDEQSLARNLSTFTGHLTRIRDVLAALPAGRSALVLLDEIGTGTDPLEGGALACAVLDALAQSGAVTLATSHLGAVKTYVHEQDRMVNAAVRFNPETLAPEYALELGRPGASQALTIAARLGFPPAVLQRASEFLSSDHLRLESMLLHIEEAQRRVEQQEREIQSVVQGLAGDREKVRAELEQLNRERKRLLHEAYQQAAGIVENARREMDRLSAVARAAHPEWPSATTGEQVKKELRRQEQTLAAGSAATAATPAQPLPAGTLRPGQRVWVEKLQGNATILAVDAERGVAIVEVGALRFTVATREIGRSVATNAPEVLPLRESRPRVDVVKIELLLIGKRVADALPEVDRFLNRAAVAGLPEVRVVHGFGTGRLQQALHDYLAQHPLVAGFRLGGGQDPGGAGATRVAIKQT